MYDASLDKIHSHLWNFTPVYSTYSMPPRWRYTTYPLNGYLSERIKWANAPRFEYDVLNLYGLNQFGFSNGAQIMVRGYDGVPGALTEETTTDDVAVVAFGKVDVYKRQPDFTTICQYQMKFTSLGNNNFIVFFFFTDLIF